MKNALTLAAAFAAACSFATTWVVTSTDDSGTPAQGTFRYAVENSDDGDTITFDSSLSGRTINLYATPGSARTDTSFTIDGKALTIEGPAGGITFNGGWTWMEGVRSDDGGRLFLIKNATGKTVFRNITFKGGHARGWSSTKEYYQGGAVGAYSDVRFENCNFIQNGACDYADYAPSLRGGGAIYSENAALEIAGCNFVSNMLICGNVAHAGAILHNGGTISVANTVFDTNRSRSYCGGIYLYQSTAAEFTDCLCLNSYTPGGNGVHAGFLWTKMPNDAPLRLTRCAFRNDKTLGSGTFGGAVYTEGSGPVYFVGCEFTGCSSESGGAVRNTGPGYYINCTFSRGASSSWGPQVDLRGKSYMVNCTLAGGFSVNTNNGNGGNVLCCYVNGTFLNTVSVYSYFGSSALTMYNDINNLSGSKTFINSVCNGKDRSGNDITYATNLDELETAAKLFADYEMVSTINYLNNDAYALAHPVVMPTLETLKTGVPDRPLTMPIAKQGLLDRTGYPVKVTADYSYCGYSTDNGATWTTLWGTDDGTAALITKDQAGRDYYMGRTPIGAATYVPEELGTLITIF